MNDGIRRDRMRRIVQLAQVYRGWSRTEAAKELGRQFNKLIPESGNPKLDLVVALADALDWSVGDVAESMCPEEAARPAGEGDFATLDERARAHHRAGEYEALVATAQAMVRLASTPHERALAANRAAGGWDGLGRYTRSLAAIQSGLAEPGLSADLRFMLQANLANAHYALWHLTEARATANDLIDACAHSAPLERVGRVGEAFAFYVRGQCERRFMETDPSNLRTHARRAREDLCAARAAHLALADSYRDDSYAGVANTCAGGLIEVEVELAIRVRETALEVVADGLDSVVDVEQFPRGDLLESWGWWAIFGANIALRSSPTTEAQRFVGIFTNKAVEIAQRLGNWSLRERAFTLEHLRRRQVEAEGAAAPWILDEEDLQTIVGTMGRFPAFRDVGWKILESASIVPA